MTDKNITRVCSKCNTEKSLSDFNRMKSDPQGRQRRCRKCQSNPRKPRIIKNLPGEEWRDVNGYEGIYQVSNLGRVMSLNRQDALGRVWPAQIIKPPKNRGYFRAGLHKDGETKCLLVHRLVAAAFIGPCPDGYTVNHKDGDKTHNRPENLEYMTNSDNAKHSINVLGNSVRGSANGKAVVNEEDVLEIRRLHAGNKQTLSDLASRYDISYSAVCAIVYNQNWQWLDG